MLNPSRKTKNSRKPKNRDVLVENTKGEYEPLEISDGDDHDFSFASHTSQQQPRGWKGAFFLSTLLLVPFLVYYIFDKSGLVIVIDKRPSESNDDTDSSNHITASERTSPGIPQPKNHPKHKPKVTWKRTHHQMGKKQHQMKHAKRNKFGGKKTMKLGMTSKARHHAPSPKDNVGDDKQNIPAQDNEPIDPVQCAEDLNIDFGEFMTKFHQEGASFCREGSESECFCESTVDAVPQSPDLVDAKGWRAALQYNVELATSTNSSSLDVVLLGDGTTEHLMGTGLGQSQQEWQQHASVFHKLFSRNKGAEIDGLALGIDGDGTQQLLYRLQNGELPPNLQPQVWWILIGTNNLSDKCSAEATLAGILEVTREIQKQRPSATIVVNSLLPRPRSPKGTLAGILWTKSEWIHARLQCFASGMAGVEYFDATSIFTNKHGDKVLKRYFEDDWIHPSAAGTRKWGEAVVAKVKELIESDDEKPIEKEDSAGEEFQGDKETTEVDNGENAKVKELIESGDEKPIEKEDSAGEEPQGDKETTEVGNGENAKVKELIESDDEKPIEKEDSAGEEPQGDKETTVVDNGENTGD